MSGGLFHTLNVGSEALFATRQGVDTAGHNIANAQVEGFSRQRVNIVQRDPLFTHGVLIGNGVRVGSITRSHDQFIEKQLTKIQQEAGRASMRRDILKNVEQIFSPELNANVTDELSKFFGSLEKLSSFPADYNVRTAVLEAGKDLSSSFRRVDRDLVSARSGLNDKIGEITAEVTDDLRRIADLNVKIRGLEVGEGQEANDLRDDRERIMRKVSSQIEMHYYEDQNGMTCVRGPNQVTLVDGGHASVVGVNRNPDNLGLSDVTITDWEGHVQRTVTNKMEGGALAALVEVRDHDLPNLLAKNDELAFSFAQEFNALHRTGFGVGDYAESAGRNFFKGAESEKGSAALIDVDDSILESTGAIAAASTPMAPGDNVIMNQLLRLKTAKVMDDGEVSFGDFYANYTGTLGLDVMRAEHISEASEVMAKDLTNRREAISGVSLDEEATNMMKWQANFRASSKVITTVDEMLDTVLSLKR